MKITKIPAKPKEQKRIRVAAYARVSSDKDAAFHSLEAQVGYYRDYVAVHPDWDLISIYSDNGISGTTDNRPEFQRMLRDCRDGKIDLVVTKSITRFARNIVVLLQTIRELKLLGIDCYFEKEDMHSISPDFRAKRSQMNRGERPVYYVSNSHEAIIDQETFDSVQAELQARAIPGNRKGTEIIRPYHLFHGLIRCGCCGRLYGYHRTNLKQYDKAVWVCPSFYSFGKAVCPSQKIPEDILISKTKEVLEVDKVDRGLLEERIKEIFVPEHNHLTFILMDESEVDVFWEHPSRSLSWTSEMKQRARERALQRYHKEEQ